MSKPRCLDPERLIGKVSSFLIILCCQLIGCNTHLGAINYFVMGNIQVRRAK